VLSVEASRIRGGRRPCKVIAGHHADGYVVLRGEDVSGRASIVEFLEPDDAHALAGALSRAADIVHRWA